MLRATDIHTYYGKSHVLFGVSLEVAKGEAVSLLGRNGAGKTTLFRSILHLAPISAGIIEFRGEPISRKPSHEIAALGIGLVPQGRRVFRDLTVRENIEVVWKRPVSPGRDWTVEKLYALFPILDKLDGRMAGTLSGGEQQMLAIARTLSCNPELVLLDEPSEGLAPLVVQALGESIETARRGEIAVFLAEQNVKFALSICSRSYILEKGQVGWGGRARDLMEDDTVRDRFLAI